MYEIDSEAQLEYILKSREFRTRNYLDKRDRDSETALYLAINEAVSNLRKITNQLEKAKNKVERNLRRKEN